MIHLCSYIIVASCIVWLGYNALAYLISHIADITKDDAKKKLNDKISEWFSLNDNEQNSPVFLSESQWNELGKIFQQYFTNVSYPECSQLKSNGVILITYFVTGVLPKYVDDRDILAQSITFDICNFYRTHYGLNICMSIKILNDEELTFYVAYNSRGIKSLENIATRKKIALKEDFKQQANSKLVLSTTKHIPVQEPYKPILLGFDLEIWEKSRQKRPISINLKTHPHLLLTGASGTGKSYALNFLFYSIAHTTHELWFGDFKSSSEFAYFKGYKHYVTGNEVEQLITDFYELFEQVRQDEITLEHPQILVLDEYPSFLQYLTMQDKKRADAIKQKIGTLLMMGRSIKGSQFALWITAQRADASLFASGGSRDNFMTWIALGNLSAEARRMITDEPLEERIYQTGEGIVKIDGKGILSLKVPEVRPLDPMAACTSLQFSSAVVDASPDASPRADV